MLHASQGTRMSSTLGTSRSADRGGSGFRERGLRVSAGALADRGGSHVRQVQGASDPEGPETSDLVFYQAGHLERLRYEDVH